MVVETSRLLYVPGFAAHAPVLRQCDFKSAIFAFLVVPCLNELGQPPPQNPSLAVCLALEQFLQFGQVLQGILNLLFLQRRPKAAQKLIDLSLLI